jgi:branched-chain amino acid transport system substrate-binding protein
MIKFQEGRKVGQSRKGKSLAILSASALMAGLLSGCGNSAAPGPGNVREVLIGETHPLTGDLAFEGNMMKDAIEMAVDDINRAGGIQSLGGAKLKLLDYDNHGSPEKGVTAVQQFVREGAVGVLGPFSSAVAMAATQEAEKDKIPFLITVAVANEITERGFKYTFRLQPDSDMMAKNFLEYLPQLKKETNTPIRTIAIAHEDSVFGTSIADYITKHASDAGFQVVANIAYPASTADLSSQVSKLKEVNADVVVPIGYLRDSSLLIQTMHQMGVSPKAIIGVANGAVSNPKFQHDYQNINNNIMDVNYSSNPVNPKTKEIYDEFKQRFGKPMDTAAVYAYEATYVLADAINRAGSTDRQKIRDALAATNFSDHILPQGPIQFGPDGQNINARAVLTQIHDGQLYVVYPTTYANAKYVFPMQK